VTIKKQKLIAEYVSNPIPVVLPFLQGVERGYVAGMSTVVVQGHNDDVGTSEETVWHEGGVYVFPTAGTQMKVSSDSANDDVGSSGATTVLINYLDTTYAEQSEIVALDGQTEVLTVATDIFRINGLTVIGAGTSKKNEGIVYIGTGTVTSGKPAVVYGLISADGDHGLASQAVYTVPLGKSAQFIEFIMGCSGGKFVEIFLDVILNGTTGAEITGSSWNIYQETVQFDGNYGLLTEKTDVYFDAKSSGASTDLLTTRRMI
jgi:hypothetical protein